MSRLSENPLSPKKLLHVPQFTQRYKKGAFTLWAVQEQDIRDGLSAHPEQGNHPYPHTPINNSLDLVTVWSLLDIATEVFYFAHEDKIFLL